jgi:hypothetical protein
MIYLAILGALGVLAVLLRLILDKSDCIFYLWSGGNRVSAQKRKPGFSVISAEGMVGHVALDILDHEACAPGMMRKGIRIRVAH